MKPERGTIEKAIVGALRAAIHDHGPITEQNVSSAAKRVYCGIRNWEKNYENISLVTDITDDFELEAILRDPDCMVQTEHKYLLKGRLYVDRRFSDRRYKIG